MIEDVFESMTSFERLDEAYRHARKQKRYRDDVLRFGSDLDSNLLELQRSVREGTFRFESYRKHWVYVPKKRLVMSLPFECRIVQWCIYLELNPYYDKKMIFDSYACRKNKGSLAAAMRLQYWLAQIENKEGDWYAVKLDISKYFYRIDHEVLLKILERDIRDERQWISNVGMPIGNLTSQLFANIYLNELDQFCKHTLHIRKYIRYMDDVIILVKGKEVAREYLKEIREFLLKELHLDLNSKTQIRPVDRRGIEFVGYRITAKRARIVRKAIAETHSKAGKPVATKKTVREVQDGGLILRKQTVRRIKMSMKGICKRYFEGRMSRAEFDRRAASYSGMMKHCGNEKLKARLNGIYLHAKEVSAMSNLQIIEALSDIIEKQNHIIREQAKVLKQLGAVCLETEKREVGNLINHFLKEPE